MLLDKPKDDLGNLNKNVVFLVVDDFETMRRVTVNQLRQLGAEKILVAKDGAEALRILRSQLVHVVLSDWNMPVMSGLELLKTLRSDEKLFTLPFVMITAEAERHRVEEAISNGVTSMLLKPYSPAQLRLRLENAFAWKPRKVVAVPAETEAQIAERQKQLVDALKRSPEPLSVQAPTPKPMERPTILIVDDTPDNLLLLSQLFKGEYRVKLAQNGHKALEICTSDEPPDLVLLDIMMPDIDGFEVARRMREHPNSESIPVIFVTAMTSADAMKQGLELGAVDFITKPVDPDGMKLKVRNFMRYVELRKGLQADYDAMVEMAQLRDVVEHITRHDLKGPVAGIMGLVQGLLADRTLSTSQLEQLRLVEETALQTLNMVNLSSELFKIESGRYVLRPQTVPIMDILNRTAELSRAAFSSKDLTITVDTDAGDSAQAPQAVGDPMLCYSMFQNLVKNACEAAPAGSRIAVRVYDQSPLLVLIKNHGAVPAQIRDRFFDKFVTAGKAGGTGLGTYSARQMALAQKGGMDLKVSDEDNTTTLIVSLPRLELPSFN